MSEHPQRTARELYLASLSGDDELAARRTAERAGIPDDDPIWLLLLEVRRATYETNRCTAALKQVVSDAAKRIEQSGSNTSALNDAAVVQFANAAGTKVAQDDRVVHAVAGAVRTIEADAVRTIHSLESSIRDFVRQRIATPTASLLFAFLLGIASACLTIWGTYHVAVGYGEDIGYRGGFHDARIYDRSHP